MYYPDLKSLKRGLDSIDSGLVLILAGEENFDYDSLKPIISQKPYDVVGAFFPGIISNSALYYSGFVLIHIQTEYTKHILTGTHNISGYFTEKDQESSLGLLFVDGLASGMQQFLDNLYYELGSQIKFVGSGAGSLTLKQTACVFDKEGIYQDTSLLILLKHDIALGIKHGYDRIEGPIIATKTNETVLKELNWGNAFNIYSELVNIHSSEKITTTDFFDVSKSFPLGISRKGQEDIVRDPISCSAIGEINCIDEIPENAALYLLQGHPDKLIAAAEEASKEAVSSVEGNPLFCLVIDCVTRVLYLGDDFPKEMKAFTETISNKYKDLLVEGVLSMGEISTYGDGRLELYNKTVLSTIVYDK